MVLLWSLHYSKKYLGRCYWKGMTASMFLISLMAWAEDLTNFVYLFFNTLIHEEIHLILKRWGEGGHNAEKTIIGPCSHMMSSVMCFTPEFADPIKDIFGEAFELFQSEIREKFLLSQMAQVVQTDLREYCEPLGRVTEQGFRSL